MREYTVHKGYVICSKQLAGDHCSEQFFITPKCIFWDFRSFKDRVSKIYKIVHSIIIFIFGKIVTCLEPEKLAVMMFSLDP